MGRSAPFEHSSQEFQSSNPSWGYLGVGATKHPEDFIEELWDLIIGVARYARITPNESMEYPMPDLLNINTSLKKLLERENQLAQEDH